MNKLYYGDNLEVLRKDIKDDTIDLCYIDPPYNSKRNYNQIYNNIGGEDKAQAQAFIDTWVWDDYAIEGYNQILANHLGRFPMQTIHLINGLEKVLGKSSLFAYLIHMTLRIAEIFRVLKPTGSFYLHCDPTASHYLKLILDSVFCTQGGDYKNEIIWHYKKWSIEQPQFVKNHDIIFFYVKSDSKERVFNQLYMDRAASTLKRFGNAKIVSGHDEAGNRIPSQTSTEESAGVAMDDVWDIGRVPPVKQLFPTQKPEPLLARIIEASSKPGDTILDVYCGCGTTIVEAERLRRNWVGVDITYQSISLILKRLEALYTKSILSEITLAGIPKDMQSAEALAHKRDDRVRKEFEKWAVLTYSNNKAFINEKKGGDGGIDGKAIMIDNDENGQQIFRDVLFNVKSEKVITPQRVREFYGTITRENAAMGYFISLYRPNDNIYHECKKYGKYISKVFNTEYPVVEIITAEDILSGKRISIPTSQQISVLKDAKAKGDKNQMGLGF